MSQTFLKDPLMIKCLLDLSKQLQLTQQLKDTAPTPQNSPTYIPMNTQTVAAPAKPHRTEIHGILLDKRKVPNGWPACLRRQPPRVALKIMIFIWSMMEMAIPMRNQKRGILRFNIKGLSQSHCQNHAP